MRTIQSLGVVGLGYVGLPLAAAFAGKGLRALGVDTDASKVEKLNSGESYVGSVPSGTLSDLVGKRLFEATTDHGRLGGVDAVCICVPTPLGEANTPDLTPVTDTARRIGRALRPEQLVVLESTTYPGTTEEVLRPILEEESGLSAERDFLLAYSPEREDPGNPKHGLSNVPKVVGGLTPEATEAAASLYARVAPSVVRVSSARAAEAAKMLENTYRAVNIALVNELKVIFEKMGVDVWEVIEAAKTKPFGFQAFTPGPGMGGHCIPVDPFYLSWRARCLGEEARFIELAGRINVEMPRRVVDKIAGALDARGKALQGAKVLLLGAAYKPDVDDDRESPFYEIAKLLSARGAVISYHDPHIPRLRPGRKHGFTLVSQPEGVPRGGDDAVDPSLLRRSSRSGCEGRTAPLDERTLAAADCVVIVTDHSAFDPEFIVRHARLVVDTRNATGEVTEGREKIVKA